MMLQFESLDEALRKIPNLRANEERISGEVRVIEIEKHDVAACAMDHADNLRECDFFLVTRVSKSGGEYEVDFVVGQQAKNVAVVLSSRLLKVCDELEANINTIESTAKKLKSENENIARKLRALGRDKLSGISPISKNKIRLFRAEFENIGDDQLQEFAGKRITDANTVVMVANLGAEMASLVFARNEKMDGIDCNMLFRQHAGPNGRGGGRAHFVTGVIKREEVTRLFDKISNEIEKSG